MEMVGSMVAGWRAIMQRRSGGSLRLGGSGPNSTMVARGGIVLAMENERDDSGHERGQRPSMAELQGGRRLERPKTQETERL